MTGSQLHHWSHSQPSVEKFQERPTILSQRGVNTPDLDEDRDSTQAASGIQKAMYRFETSAEAGDRRRSAAEAHDASQNITLDEPMTYMQRVLVEHGASNATLGFGLHQVNCEDHPTDRETGAPVRGHLRTTSTGSVPARNARRTILSTGSLASTDAGELALEYIRETASLRNTLRESMQSESIRESVEPSRRRTGPISASQEPFSFQLDQSSSPAPNREDHQNAALRALDGAPRGDAIQACGSGQWLGGARHSSHGTRRQGKVDWKTCGLFSSTGRQYGLGNQAIGYANGQYVTVLQRETVPEKKKSKRDTLRGVLCFAGQRITESRGTMRKMWIVY
ncbi:hypothetical protein BDW02DRAFT_597994 [Decorospora gaudefroyi]|uniref:Uncharacterized protein n=1 Tax=Decorospora gaudefroyi TaxID=184978 RepID=A0A6A5KM74_9PLEO|nr:hypothetical protein BDW02DRAFT_597994 [Decorospora gaudefroyi]